MPDVQPFRGLRYNVERIGDISAVISPPYDIISPQEQEFYYEQSPYNVVRLEFGSDEPCGSPQSNKYTRAADTLKRWLEAGILFREPIPVFYIFEHHLKLSSQNQRLRFHYSGSEQLAAPFGRIGLFHSGGVRQQCKEAYP